MCTGDKNWGEEEEGRKTREEMRGKRGKGGEGRRKKERRGKEEEREEEREEEEEEREEEREEEEGGTLCKKGRLSVLTYFSFLSKSLAAKTGAFRNVFSPAGFMGEQ